MKKIVIFYHKDCPDGFGAAWAAWKKLGNKAEYVGISPNPDKKFLQPFAEKSIYFLDAAPDKKEIIEDLRRRNKSVVLIDHHISRKPTLSAYSSHLFSLNHSGAALSWTYFNNKKSVPWLLRYIEEYDIWRFRLPSSKKLHAIIDLADFDFPSWDRLAKNFENKIKRDHYADEGQAILRYINRSVKDLASKAEWVAFKGHRALAVNSPVLKDDIGNYLSKRYKLPFAIIWQYERQNYRISLRAGTADVSKISEKYGGGGHKKAAGFLWPVKNGFPWKPIGQLAERIRY